MVSPSANFLRKKLLAALSNADLALLQPQLEPMELEVRKVASRKWPWATELVNGSELERALALLNSASQSTRRQRACRSNRHSIYSIAHHGN